MPPKQAGLLEKNHLNLSPIIYYNAQIKINWDLTPINLFGIWRGLHYICRPA